MSDSHWNFNFNKNNNNNNNNRKNHINNMTDNNVTSNPLHKPKRSLKSQNENELLRKSRRDRDNRSRSRSKSKTNRVKSKRRESNERTRTPKRSRSRDAKHKRRSERRNNRDDNDKSMDTEIISDKIVLGSRFKIDSNGYYDTKYNKYYVKCETDMNMNGRMTFRCSYDNLCMARLIVFSLLNDKNTQCVKICGKHNCPDHRMSNNGFTSTNTPNIPFIITAPLKQNNNSMNSFLATLPRLESDNDIYMTSIENNNSNLNNSKLSNNNKNYSSGNRTESKLTIAYEKRSNNNRTDENGKGSHKRDIIDLTTLRNAPLVYRLFWRSHTNAFIPPKTNKKGVLEDISSHPLLKDISLLCNIGDLQSSLNELLAKLKNQSGKYCKELCNIFSKSVAVSAENSKEIKAILSGKNIQLNLDTKIDINPLNKLHSNNNQNNHLKNSLQPIYSFHIENLDVINTNKMHKNQNKNNNKNRIVFKEFNNNGTNHNNFS